MPPKLSLKRKTESKPVPASVPPEQRQKKTETSAKSAKKLPKLKVTLAPYQWKGGNKLKRGNDKNKVPGYEWKPFPPSDVLKEIYSNANAKDVRLS